MSSYTRHSTALPKPSADERAHSQRLGALIREEIACAGSVPFSRFMELALYAPGLGYYAAGTQKFGAAGDFITAPESFPLFGRCLARTAREILDRLGAGAILEVGAGSGRLAATLLGELAASGKPPDYYYILELSADLRERQALAIKQAAPELFGRVHWLDRLPQPGFRGLMLANEVLDAMPVERFRIDHDSVTRLGVTWRDGRFEWTHEPAPAAVVERVTALHLAPGYVSEMGLAAEAWVRSIGERIEAGVLLIVDYGFPRAEFYHPDRAAGTLMCHYRHRAHSDPLILPGLQDITAHVDFTAVAEAGTNAGLELLGYTSQAAFLVGAGIEDFVRASDPADVRAHLALTGQVKKLTLPHEMGELYKVIALGRSIPADLSPFALQDRRRRL
jgi:SAM-dependent MidA family methyltransferase